MFQRKLAWIELILVALVFTVPFFSIGFSKITLPGIQVANATQDLLPLYGEDPSAALLGIGNYTKWSLNPSPSIGAVLSSSTNKLTLNGTFPASSSPSAVSISRSFVANITQYPILYLQMNVSKGVSYGIRFDMQNPDGNFVATWKDTDVLNHRQGTGRPENIQVNMLQVIQSNTNVSARTLARVTVYVERGPNPGPTRFALLLEKFEFLNYRFKPAESPGLYHSIYLTLNTSGSSNFSSTLRSLSVEGRLNASPNSVYVIYFFFGSIIYRSGTYTYDPASPDEVYLISLPAERLKSFPDNLPISGISVVIVSASGTLYQFGVRSVTINYNSRVTEAASLPPSKDPPIFYIAIFVFLPLAIALLLYDHFRGPRSERSVERQSPRDVPRG